MKIITLFLFMLIISILNLSAQNLIAVQSGGTPTFYTSLTTAVDSAVDGDTIYLPGGVFGDISLNKKLHIIGTGHNSDSTNATNRSVIGNITLDTGADNGSISGIFIAYALNFRSTVHGYEFFRCNINYIWYMTICTNISFIENIINRVYGRNDFNEACCSKSYFSNNIIYDYVYYTDYCTYKNNIILGQGQNQSTFESCFFCTIENNFIWGLEYFRIHNCILNNNVLTFRYGSGTIIENNTSLVNVPFDSLFVNYNDGMRNAYSIYDADFRLKPGSPFLNAGRDGTDIGIYGGAFPWKEGSIPVNPHFQSVRIAGQTDSDGNLNVQIKVAAQDN